MMHPPTASHSGDSTPRPDDVAISANQPQRSTTAPQEPPARKKRTHKHRDYTAAHIDDSDLDVYARRLLHHINRREGEDPCTASVAAISAVCCMSAPTVRKRLRLLGGKGEEEGEEEGSEHWWESINEEESFISVERPPGCNYRLRIAPNIKGDISTSRRLDEAGLSPYAFALFHRVLRRSGTDGTGCYEKQKHIAKALSTTENRLRKARHELESRDFITVKHRGRGTILMRPCPPSQWKAKEETTSDTDNKDTANAPSPSTHADTASPATQPHAGQIVPENPRKALRERYASGDWSADDPAQHPAVKMMLDPIWFGAYSFVKDDVFVQVEVARAVTDFDAWFAVLKYWRINRHKGERVGKMLDRYKRTMRGEVSKWNGTRNYAEKHSESESGVTTNQEGHISHVPTPEHISGNDILTTDAAEDLCKRYPGEIKNTDFKVAVGSGNPNVSRPKAVIYKPRNPDSSPAPNN